jgi:hypothetical protein
MFDAPLAPLVAQLAPRLRSVRAFVVLTDRGHMPQVGTRAAHGSHHIFSTSARVLAHRVAHCFSSSGAPKVHACAAAPRARARACQHAFSAMFRRGRACANAGRSERAAGSAVLLRGAAGGGGGRGGPLPLGGGGRGRRLRPVLHVRHHRAAKGAVSAPPGLISRGARCVGSGRACC